MGDIYIQFIYFLHHVCLIQVTIALRFHLFPFRTEKLSSVTPMVLRNSGRVGSRRFFREAPVSIERYGGFIVFVPLGTGLPECIPIEGASLGGFSYGGSPGIAFISSFLVILSLSLQNKIGEKRCFLGKWVTFISFFLFDIKCFFVILA